MNIEKPACESVFVNGGLSENYHNLNETRLQDKMLSLDILNSVKRSSLICHLSAVATVFVLHLNLRSDTEGLRRMRGEKREGWHQKDGETGGGRKTLGPSGTARK